MVVPEKIFFTKGCGAHQDKLISFEMALRDAGLASYNLVPVSSIVPPNAEIISRKEGLSHLSSGEIVYCVMARMGTNIPGQRISSSIGFAVPDVRGEQHGYISEYHTAGISDHECGEYAENLAATMLATIMDLPLPLSDTSCRKCGWVSLTSGKKIRTNNLTASVVCTTDRQWVTVIAAAVFILP